MEYPFLTYMYLPGQFIANGWKFENGVAEINTTLRIKNVVLLGRVAMPKSLEEAWGFSYEARLRYPLRSRGLLFLKAFKPTLASIGIELDTVNTHRIVLKWSGHIRYEGCDPYTEAVGELGSVFFAVIDIIHILNLSHRLQDSYDEERKRLLKPTQLAALTACMELGTH